MSSRAGKMTKQIKQNPGKTAVYRVDFEVATRNDVVCTKSAVVEVSGIPEEYAHEEYDTLAKHTAQTTFCNVLNQRAYLEVYPEGKTAKGAEPSFLNLINMVMRISIKDVVWLEEK